MRKNKREGGDGQLTTRLRSRRKAVARQKKRGGRRNARTKAANRGIDGRRNAEGSRRNAEGAEMRGLKRQTRDADERSNAVGSRRNAPAAERRSAGLSGRWRAAVSHRPLAAPAPLLSIIALARALFPTTSAFSLCSLPRSPQFYNSSPARPSLPRAPSPTTSTPRAPSSQS